MVISWNSPTATAPIGTAAAGVAGVAGPGGGGAAGVAAGVTSRASTARNGEPQPAQESTCLPFAFVSRVTPQRGQAIVRRAMRRQA